MWGACCMGRRGLIKDSIDRSIARLQAEHRAQAQRMPEGPSGASSADSAAWENELAAEQSRLEAWSQELCNHQAAIQSR